MTCKECTHYDVCQAIWDTYGISKIHPSQCGCFKGKSKMIELPCSVGNEVYIIVDCEEPFIDKGSVKSFSYNGEKLYIYAVYNCGLTYWHSTDDIGNTLFYTEKEAKKALKELKMKSEERT